MPERRYRSCRDDLVVCLLKGLERVDDCIGRLRQGHIGLVLDVPGHRTGWTLSALRALSSLRPLDSLRALSALYALRALDPGGALRALSALAARTLDALGTLASLDSLRALRTLQTLSSLGALGSLLPLRPLSVPPQPRETGFAQRVRAGVVQSFGLIGVAREDRWRSARGGWSRRESPAATVAATPVAARTRLLDPRRSFRRYSLPSGMKTPSRSAVR